MAVRLIAVRKDWYGASSAFRCQDDFTRRFHELSTENLVDYIRNHPAGTVYCGDGSFLSPKVTVGLAGHWPLQWPQTYADGFPTNNIDNLPSF